jgi:hypothetical protein
MHGAIERGDDLPFEGLITRAPNSITNAGLTPRERFALAFLDPESEVFADDNAAKQVAQALDRVLTGDASDDDRWVLDRLPAATSYNLELVGQLYGADLKAARAASENAAAAPAAAGGAIAASHDATRAKLKALLDVAQNGPTERLRNEARTALIQLQKASNGRVYENDETLVPAKPDTEQNDELAVDEADDAPDTYGLSDTPRDALASKPYERLGDLQPGTKEFDAVRNFVLGARLRAKPDSEAYQSRLQRSVVTPEGAIDLSQLAVRVRGRNGEQQSLESALQEGLAEMVATGIEFDASTLKPHTIRMKNDEVLRLSARTVANLRGANPKAWKKGVEMPVGPRRAPQAQVPQRTSEDPEFGDRDTRLMPRELPPQQTTGDSKSVSTISGIREVRGVDPLGDRAMDARALKRKEAYDAKVEAQIESTLERARATDRTVLAAEAESERVRDQLRAAKPGTPKHTKLTADLAEADARIERRVAALKARLEPTIKAARNREDERRANLERAIDKLAGKKKFVRATPFEAGVAIGEEVLRGQLEGRRLEQALKRLRDPESGVARKYYEEALTTDKFVKGAGVKENAWDDEAPDRAADSKERALATRGYKTKDGGEAETTSAAAPMSARPDVELIEARKDALDSRGDWPATKLGRAPSAQDDRPRAGTAARDVEASLKDRQDNKGDLVARAEKRAADEQPKNDVVVPKGAKVVVGEDPYAKPGSKIKYDSDAEEIHRELYGDTPDAFAATHDSPIRHEGKFNWRENRLKGEGAAAFGEGTYLSTSNGVHRGYKEGFTAKINNGAKAYADRADNIKESLAVARDKLERLQQALDFDDGIQKPDEAFVVTEYIESSGDFGYTIFRVFQTKKGALREALNQVQYADSNEDAEQQADDLVRSVPEYRNKLETEIAALQKELDGLTADLVKSPTYQVTVRATRDEILDWDKPLGEQSADVQAKVRAAFLDDSMDAARKKGREKVIVSLREEIAADKKKLEKLDAAINRAHANGLEPNLRMWRLLKTQIAKQETRLDRLERKNAAKRDTDLSWLPEARGGDVYHQLKLDLESGVAASDLLQKHGLVGHKYAASGGRNDRFPNYVIYDDSRITTNFVKLDRGPLPTGAPNPNRDLKREEDMLNALLARMGIKRKIKLVEGTRKGGAYDEADGTIYIHPGLSNAERFEVMAHELGHHIFAVEWENASPETKAAIEADYQAWRKKQRGKTTGETRASRAALHRAANVGKDTGSRKYALDFEEYLADGIARALSQNTIARGVVAQFFQKLAKKLRDAYDALLGTSKDKWKAPPSIDAWVAELFARETEAVAAVARATLSKDATQKLVDAAVRHGRASATTKPLVKGPKDLDSMVEFVKYTLKAETRQLLERVLARSAVQQKLREVYDAPVIRAMLDDSAQGMERRIALAYLAWRDGHLNLSGNARSAMVSWTDDLQNLLGLVGEGDMAQRIFTDIASGQVESFHARGIEYNVKALEGSKNKAVALRNKISKALDPIARGWSRVMQSKFQRARDSGIPAYREIASLLARHTGDTGSERGYYGTVRDLTAQRAREFDKAWAPVKGHAAAELRVMRYLQRNPDDSAELSKLSEAEQAVVKSLRAMMVEAYAYLREADVLGETTIAPERFFPVVLNVRDEQSKAKLRELLDQEKFHDEILRFAGLKKENGESVTFKSPEDAKKALDAALDDLVNGADSYGLLESKHPESLQPGFRGANMRLMQFIYDLGTRPNPDHDPKVDGKTDAEKFAELQTPDPKEVFARYFMPAIRRAEYIRRFGGDADKKGKHRDKLDALKEEMKRQGATEQQLLDAEVMVEAATGSYGADGSPVLRTIAPGLADRFKGRKTQAVLQGAQAYQNIRLLPLSLLSSLADPLGLVARTGGDWGPAWEGMKTGFKAMFKGAAQADMQQMLETLGMADDTMTWQTLQGLYGGDNNPTAQAVNETLFKYNGLAHWTQATRNMALVAAHGFLLKHAEGKDARSQRYLQELGLERGDVQGADGRVRVMSKTEAELAPKAERERNERVRNALLQFVDEAVLRPNPQQTPQWHSDPYLGVVTQYKAFLYAMNDQIIARLNRESSLGNHTAYLSALAYLPVVLMAELLRELIQYAGDGNPRRKDWGAGDYVTLAVERSGLLGPSVALSIDTVGDAKQGRFPGVSQLGPTAGQVRNVLQSADNRRDWWPTFEEALPLSAGWKHWNDGEEQ